MADTLDSVPGTWTLWVRTAQDPTSTVTYQAVFTAPAQLTVTGDGTSYKGTWKEKGSGVFENVTFTIENLLRPGEDSNFSGYMVGLAMGGGIGSMFDPSGAWSAYKTSD